MEHKCCAHCNQEKDVHEPHSTRDCVLPSPQSVQKEEYTVGNAVRDICEIPVRSKSEVRRIIARISTSVREETLKEAIKYIAEKSKEHTSLFEELVYKADNTPIEETYVHIKMKDLSALQNLSD